MGSQTVYEFDNEEEVYWDGDHVVFTVGASCCDLYVTRDEAIAAARAILKHFNVGVE